MSVLLSEITPEFIQSAGEPHTHWNSQAFVYFDPDTKHCFLYDPDRNFVIEFYYDDTYHGKCTTPDHSWTEASPVEPHRTEYELMKMEIAHQMGEGHSNQISPEG